MKKIKIARRALIALVLAMVGAIPLVAESEIVKLEANASYYGEEFNGRPTSSGEIFDMNALTAAHKTLPFGTMLEVTNLENGKKVIVRVNDRGPFVEDRELDVSKGAAAELGMLGSGITKVSIRKVSDPAPAQVAAATPAVAEVTPPSGTEPTVDAAPVAAETAVVATPAEPAVASAPAAADASQAPTSATPSPVSESASVAVSATVDSATPAAPAPTAPASAAASATAVTEPSATPSPVAKSSPIEAPVAASGTPAAVPTATKVAPAIPSARATGPQWRIQLGAFAREDNATRLVVRLRKDGFNPAFEKAGNLTRVVIAGIEDKDLKRIRAKLDAAGYGEYFVRKEAW